MHSPVDVTIDGRTVTIPAGNYSFHDLAGQLGLDQKTTIKLTVAPPPPQATEVRSGHSVRVHGGEKFTSVHQPAAVE